MLTHHARPILHAPADHTAPPPTHHIPPAPAHHTPHALAHDTAPPRTGTTQTTHTTQYIHPSDPDAPYRDLLLRVREEREQLGQIVDHPF